ncbi:hypothetical protein CPB84DRAFT_1690841 [Gymnopilus junonius]|uniref:PBP domain-containing protein n=1 Tax=Gymnopilus junonius TaxID=109634 RepID=A0A9P5NB57_GYMJU|nr:hypothetical protein CPB84DRAFT_1690841 [Gymnopilus junonius]
MLFPPLLRQISHLQSCIRWRLRPSTVQGIRLRIANGAAGQTGLVKAWAHAFIRYMVEKGHEPFQVTWYLSESTESLSLLSKGEVDFALTYVPAAEAQLIHVGDASERVYAFRDQFVLVGPKSNPAGLKDDDDIFLMINKIVCHGHADAANPPKDHPPTRFFSRSDRSATNIKESLLFLTIGQLPWALNNPSTWYHRHQCFPREALKIAASQSFYTLIDRGTWLDAAEDVTSALKAFRIGGEDLKYDPTDFLLNPAHLLCGSRLRPDNESICKEFMKWVMADEGGQRVIDTFEKNGRVLYTRPPSLKSVHWSSL